MPRTYKTVAEVIPELEVIIAELKANGVQVLPSERQLAKKTESSVMTLRKALLALEERRVFVKKGRVRLLSGTTSEEQLTALSVAFVATGNERPSNIEWLRLSSLIGEQLRDTAIDFRTVCFSYQDGDEAFARAFASPPDVIILADAPSRRVRARTLALQDRSLVISPDQNDIGKCQCVVSRNNYQAGQLAARTLIEAGCRRPAINYTDTGYMPFFHRRDGFVDALLQAGLPVENCTFRNRRYDQDIPDALTVTEIAEKICADGFDGFFLMFDGSCMQIREIIRKHYSIPDEFRLITLDSTGECRNSPSPVTSISHGTEDVAATIVANLKAYSCGQTFDRITLVDSELVPGDTT